MSVKEYFFDRHKRVLVVYEENATLLSIDIYDDKWMYPVNYSLENQGISLLYHRVDGEKIGAEWIEYVGLKTPEGLETINIRVYFNRILEENEIKEIYHSLLTAINQLKRREGNNT